MASYMPQQLFNMCAVAAAKFSLLHGEPIEPVSEYVAQQYSHMHRDEHLLEDIATAAKAILQYLRSAGPEHLLLEHLRQMEFCIKHYEPDGRKRPTKLFGGSWFNKEQAPLQDKAKHCVAHILAYNLRVIGGSIPVAPPGWRL